VEFKSPGAIKGLIHRRTMARVREAAYDGEYSEKMIDAINTIAAFLDAGAMREGPELRPEPAHLPDR
jgi:hypothetical protein